MVKSLHPHPPRVAFVGGGVAGVLFLKKMLEHSLSGRIDFIGGCADGVLSIHNEQIYQAIVESNGTAFASINDLLDSKPDAVLSVGNTHIFSQEEIDRAGNNIVNFHAAPLPEYRGSACAAFAILNGERQFGATFHLIGPALDAGDIIHQISFPIDHRDNSIMLDSKAIVHGVEAYRELGEKLFDGSLGKNAQIAFAKPPYRRRDIEPHRQISFTWDEDRIDRHVRACDWDEVLEPAYVVLSNGKQIYLTASARGTWIHKSSRQA